MIGRDNERRSGSMGFIPRGHHPTFRCWRCSQSTTGAKLVGRLKLRVCAGCVGNG